MMALLKDSGEKVLKTLWLEKLFCLLFAFLLILLFYETWNLSSEGKEAQI